MGRSAHKEQPLIDPFGAPLIHCDGVGPILVENGQVHIVLWAEQVASDGRNIDRVITVRVVAPVEKARANLFHVSKVLAKLMVGMH